jgi:hypothetical protein
MHITDKLINAALATIDGGLELMKDLDTGAVDSKIASAKNATYRTVQSGVKTASQMILNKPKIIAQEAKLIEQAQPKQVDHKAA